MPDVFEVVLISLKTVVSLETSSKHRLRSFFQLQSPGVEPNPAPHSPHGVATPAALDCDPAIAPHSQQPSGDPHYDPSLLIHPPSRIRLHIPLLAHLLRCLRDAFLVV